MKKLLVIATMCIFPVLSCSKASAPSSATGNATPTETKDATQVPESVVGKTKPLPNDNLPTPSEDGTVIVPAK